MLPGVATAQSGIAGVVKDTSGAVMPGVTVEASSPALIEKVRSAVTDGQGQYKVVDLRPGIYDVIFTLAGFSTVKRTGVTLTTNFTAQVNADMVVGALEETLTVSGQSPVVDVQNVTQQRVLTNEVVAALPNSRMLEQLATLIPGITLAAAAKPSAQDVGGSSSEGQQRMAIHGGRSSEMQAQVDGMPYNQVTGPSSTGVYMDAGAIQEFAYEVGASSAEIATAGVRINSIPRDGGNRFAGTIFGTFTNRTMQSRNLTDALVQRGLAAPNRIDKIWDLNPSMGGPIIRDRLWVFGSSRYWGINERVAGLWVNQTPKAPVYTPDLSQQAIDDTWLLSGTLRFTWQATQTNKISAFLLKQNRCNCHRTISATKAPEAALWMHNPVDDLVQIKWTSTVSNRLLLEAGFMPYWFTFNFDPEPDVTPDRLAITELSTGFNYRASSSLYSKNPARTFNYKAAATYVTGSHALKAGLTLQRGSKRFLQHINGDMTLQLLNGVPRSVTVFATPYVDSADVNSSLGIYGQDQWTVKRLTISAGLRFDHLNVSVPEQHLAPVQFVGARDFGEVRKVPNWNDVSPRIGLAYDLFGNGKTAVKATINRYVAGETVAFAGNNNPINTSVNSATRTWSDANGDVVPQASELGPLSNASFGKVVIRTRYDDTVKTGFGARGYNWEGSAGVQHEIVAGTSVNATYFRRSYGNFLVTDNTLVAPSDYDPFCITAPADARLPNGGGQVCGLYDVNPRKFGQVDNLVTYASAYGDMYERWNGVDLTLNSRLPRRGLLSGGLSSGRTTFDNCDVAAKVDNAATQAGLFVSGTTVASPDVRFCHQQSPFLTQVKLQATVPLPWDLQASATYQSLPGPEITASYSVPSSAIRPSLGRDLSAGANATAAIQLVQPGTMYGQRLNQFDVRMTKIFKAGAKRLNVNLDLYNFFNASTVLVQNNTYGPAWQRPTYILPGRLFKVGTQLNF
jgi:hypothetical protein